MISIMDLILSFLYKYRMYDIIKKNYK